MDPTQPPAVSAGAASRAVLEYATRLRNSASGINQALAGRRDAAARAFTAELDAAARRHVAQIPLERLKSTPGGERLRLGAIEDAGFTTVGAAAAAGTAGLDRIPGVGDKTAAAVLVAAAQLADAARAEVRVRFDPDSRAPGQTQLLTALAAYDTARRNVGPLAGDLAALVAAIDPLLGQASQATSRMKLFFAGSDTKDAALAAVAQLDAIARHPATATLVQQMHAATAALAAPPTPDVWQDFVARPVAYNELLGEIGGQAPAVEAAQGFVPSEIAERVSAHELDTSRMKTALRGYQAFGAQFALVQRRAILGDEMGLGKTVEALAAMAHLHAAGETHMLVVCPASVLRNWSNETQRHAHLSTIEVHGSDRADELDQWAAAGGVAVTTFESLRSLELPDGVPLALMVVDEAHYVKNPAAQRSQAVKRWSLRAERALYLTGTPMENRVEEFRELVAHLQPDVAAQVSAFDGVAGAVAFRRSVAPVYLRRNQADVLTELPPRIETVDWVSFGEADGEAYRDALVEGNFMAMRQAAFAPGTPETSAKLARLVEVASEAMANGRKVVVFSYFLKVLAVVAEALGDAAMGPISGSVPPAQRQALVDAFTARPEPAVLLAQIEAGGVGLNIQAASVVILCEPQWKPSIEEQAIARAHRMGQVRPVEVHRLVAADSVDGFLREILAKKKALFDEYVRISELRDASPDAVDTDRLVPAGDADGTAGGPGEPGRAAERAGAAVAAVESDDVEPGLSQAQAERQIIERERRRLGIVATDASADGGPAAVDSVTPAPQAAAADAVVPTPQAEVPTAVTTLAPPAASAAATPPPGWFADPWGKTRLRWWDGSAWTGHTAD